MALLMHTSLICSPYFITYTWGPDCSPSSRAGTANPVFEGQNQAGFCVLPCSQQKGTPGKSLPTCLIENLARWAGFAHLCSKANSKGCFYEKHIIENTICISTVTFDLSSHSAASEDALRDLRPGHQLRPTGSEQKRPGDRPVGLRDPHERRSHPGPSQGRGPAHELARHSSLQPTEGAAEPAGAAQHQPRRGVRLLGTEQLHETGRERSRLQQPQTDEAADAWTQALHHLSVQNVKIWWTLQKGNGDWQVNVSKEKCGGAFPFSNTLLSILALILAYKSQVHKKGAGNYNFSF